MFFEIYKSKLIYLRFDLYCFFVFIYFGFRCLELNYISLELSYLFGMVRGY